MDRKNFAHLTRIEDKYVVPKEMAQKLRQEVEKHLDVAYPNKSVKFTNVKSTYLDSDSAQFYRDHLNQKNQRLKIRLRSYGPDGKWENFNYLEVKSKDDETVIKDRIELDKENSKRLMDEQKVVVNDKLLSLNKKLLDAKGVKQLVDKVNTAVTEYALKPILTVNYKRYAYEDGPVRVTFDQNLSYKDENGINSSQKLDIVDMVDFSDARSYAKKYNPSKDAIVEVKYELGLPEWLENSLKEFKMNPEGMSKYVWSMYKLLTRDLGSDLNNGSDLFNALMGK